MALDSITSFWLWQFLGRLHPVIVHFPIGVLMSALFLELLTLRGRRPGLRAGIDWLVKIGAATALLATAQGWLLSRTGDYAGTLVQYHQWAGTATAALAVLTVFLLRRVREGDASSLHAYRAVLTVSAVSLTVAGHLGASLTHGRDFLTSTLPWNRVEEPGDESRVLLAHLSTLDSSTGLSEPDLDRLNLQVRAIFAHSCYRCHSSDKSEGGLMLDSEKGVMAGGEGGPILVAGRSAESEIMRRLRLPSDHEDAMPGEGKPLSEHEIKLIGLWIDAGAHWTDRPLKTFREAKLALTMPPLPVGPHAPSNPVDRFVGAYFARNRIRWPEPVGDAVFMRRAYLDVVGLVPEPREVDAFLADKRADKRARLVDALLARDHDYAQHWLSFWNDLLRNDYSGPGFITGGRRQITPWLYQSLLTNKPYNAMVRELVSPDSMSEGFIRGIRWRGTVNASQRTEMQAAQNISQALLGVNLKCASCHNSFVSNLTLDQAYAFANVFADTTLEIYRCDKPTGQLAQTGFLYPQLGALDATLPPERRLAQLAGLITRPENGRLYRTIVNRLWGHLMGRGFVEPVDEMDNLPWSQELLDWLTADLVKGGYDLKRTLRTIMLSRTYQLPSVGVEDAGEVMDQDFVFRGPLRRRLSAEQFADALSQTLAPVYHTVAYDPYEIETPSKWIWYDAEQDGRNSLPQPGTYYFRRPFELPPGSITRAEILIAVDHGYRLSLNGQEIDRGRAWREVHRLDVTRHLRAGQNILAVEGENEGTIPNPAGLLLSLKITFADGSEQEVSSDEEWRATDTAPGAGWRAHAYDDSAWKEVRSFGSHGKNRYWGRLLAFTHAPDRHPLRFARASLVESDPFLKALGRPTRELVITNRDDEATLLQALELTNGTFLNAAVARGAGRWLSASAARPEVLVRQVYRQAFQRSPTRRELKAALKALGPKPRSDVVQDFLWAVVLLPEFQLIY
jgi:uncharacterized membrane protein/mono/diheme cytochrome c family protein